MSYHDARASTSVDASCASITRQAPGNRTAGVKYALREFDVASLPASVPLAADESGLGAVLRDRDRLVGFRLEPKPEGTDAVSTRGFYDHDVRAACLIERMRDELAVPAGLAPSISVAICSKDNATLVARVLDSLDAIRDAELEILVIDNASVTDGLKTLCAGRAGVRYVREPLVGLDFARNRAVTEATGDIVAFLDDDVRVDRLWLWAMRRAWSENPDAGCITGLVLPMFLDTEARVLFEQRGGFRRGFRPLRFGREKFQEVIHPCGAGRFGAGANMSVRRQLVLDLGGFDEALDTGRPLPGGGDLDIFYRVLRAGASLVYEPQAAVYHEHRRGLHELKRQYYTWGLGFAAFVEKSRRADPAMALHFRRTMQFWAVYQTARLVRRLTGNDPTPASMILAEIKGLVVGSFGEYERSVRRSRAIRAAHAS